MRNKILGVRKRSTGKDAVGQFLLQLWRTFTHCRRSQCGVGSRCNLRERDSVAFGGRSAWLLRHKKSRIQTARHAVDRPSTHGGGAVRSREKARAVRGDEKLESFSGSGGCRAVRCSARPATQTKDDGLHCSGSFNTWRGCGHCWPSADWTSPTQLRGQRTHRRTQIHCSILRIQGGGSCSRICRGKELDPRNETAADSLHDIPKWFRGFMLILCKLRLPTYGVEMEWTSLQLVVNTTTRNRNAVRPLKFVCTLTLRLSRSSSEIMDICLLRSHNECLAQSHNRSRDSSAVH